MSYTHSEIRGIIGLVALLAGVLVALWLGGNRSPLRSCSSSKTHTETVATADAAGETSAAADTLKAAGDAKHPAQANKRARSKKQPTTKPKRTDKPSPHDRPL